MPAAARRTLRRHRSGASACDATAHDNPGMAVSAVYAPVPGRAAATTTLHSGRAAAAVAELLAANATGADPHQVLPDQHHQLLAQRLIGYLSRDPVDHARTLDARPVTHSVSGREVTLTPVLTHDGDGVVLISLRDLADLLADRS